MDRRDFVSSMTALSATGLVGLTPSRLDWRQAPIVVNGERLNRHLTELSAFGRTDTGTNRVAYSEGDLAGRRYVQGLMTAAGLDVRIDTAGNILGRRPGTDPSLPTLLFGSHIDSVTDGGNYDGDVGSIGAIEVAHTLIEREVPTRHPLEVVIFQNEEGGTIGSKLMSSGLTPTEFDRIMRSEITIRDGTEIIGGDLTRLDQALRKRGDLLCYLELHIEQGGLLEQTGIQIGVVEGIVGLRWFEVTFTGFANHAGTTPMDQRQDAMLAAARFTVAINEAIRSEPGRQVATVGRLIAVPGTTNVIPGSATLTIDLRDLSVDTLTHFTTSFQAIGQRIATETDTTFAMRPTSTNEPAPTDPRLRQIIEEAAGSLRLTSRRMPSGAGHDAQEIAHIAPVGMIFVPSVGGISHSPNELTRPEDATNGANVLLQTVLTVDRQGLG